MFKDDTEIETLLGHENNTAVQVKIIGQGQDDRSDRRNKGIREKLSLETKTKIGTLASILGVKATSELTGKNESQVSNIKNGLNGVRKKDQELTTELEVVKTNIQSKALTRAEQFLEMLGGSGDIKEDLIRASIAEKTVNIYEKLTPKNPEVKDQRVQILFYAPRTKESSEYPIIEVEAQNG